jgi:hypothetical protein
MSFEKTKNPSPTSTLAAVAVEQCLQVLDDKLGPLNEAQRYVLTLDLSKMVAAHIQRDVMCLLTGNVGSH